MGLGIENGYFLLAEAVAFFPDGGFAGEIAGIFAVGAVVHRFQVIGREAMFFQQSFLCRRNFRQLLMEIGAGVAVAFQHTPHTGDGERTDGVCQLAEFRNHAIDMISLLFRKYPIGIPGAFIALYDSFILIIAECHNGSPFLGAC